MQAEIREIYDRLMELEKKSREAASKLSKKELLWTLLPSFDLVGRITDVRKEVKRQLETYLKRGGDEVSNYCIYPLSSLLDDLKDWARVVEDDVYTNPEEPRQYRYHVGGRSPLGRRDSEVLLEGCSRAIERSTGKKPESVEELLKLVREEKTLSFPSALAQRLERVVRELMELYK